MRGELRLRLGSIRVLVSGLDWWFGVLGTVSPTTWANVVSSNWWFGMLAC